MDLQAKIKALEARFAQCQPDSTIGREKLPKKRKAAAARIEEDFMQRRAVVRKSLNKIIITDDSIEMQCIGDYDITVFTTCFCQKLKSLKTAR